MRREKCLHTKYIHIRKRANLFFLTMPHHVGDFLSGGILSRENIHGTRFCIFLNRIFCKRMSDQSESIFYFSSIRIYVRNRGNIVANKVFLLIKYGNILDTFRIEMESEKAFSGVIIQKHGKILLSIFVGNTCDIDDFVKYRFYNSKRIKLFLGGLYFPVVRDIYHSRNIFFRHESRFLIFLFESGRKACRYETTNRV